MHAPTCANSSAAGSGALTTQCSQKLARKEAVHVDHNYYHHLIMMVQKHLVLNGNELPLSLAVATSLVMAT